jgi:hypothetical protein
MPGAGRHILIEGSKRDIIKGRFSVRSKRLRKILKCGRHSQCVTYIGTAEVRNKQKLRAPITSLQPNITHFNILLLIPYSDCQSQTGWLVIRFFPPMPPHVHTVFVVPTPGWGRSITDFWDWGAYRAQLRRPDDVSDDMCERGVPGEALKPNSTGYPDHGRYGDLPLHGKIPTAEAGIEPGTSWLVVRSSDHQAMRPVCYQIFN